MVGKRLEGILTALPFPGTADGALRRDVLQRHINDSIAAGVHGFWLNGGTGCSVYLNADQRRQSLEAAVEAVAGRVPVLCMVAALTTADGIALARHAQRAGANGVSALPPLVYPTTVREIISYLKALKEAADLPMTYYHVPGLTKVALDAAHLAELCEQVPLAAIKFSEVDFFKATEIVHRCPNVAILTGFEELLLGGLAMRCVTGTVGATQNFLPGPLVELYTAFQQGDLARAQRLHAGISRVAAVQGAFDFTAVTYAILNLLGYDYGYPVPPMKCLDDAQIAELKSALLKVLRPEPLHERRLIESRDLLFTE